MNDTIQIQQFHEGSFKFIPKIVKSEHQLLSDLSSLFEKYVKDGFTSFALDLSHVSRLSDDLIVFVLQVTAMLRRKGGDLHIHSLHYNLLEDLLTFNPKDYLAIVDQNSPTSRIPGSSKRNNDDLIPPYSLADEISADDSLEKNVETMEIAYDEDDVYKACDFVLSRAAEIGFSENELSRIKIAVYEACLNAIQHTRKLNPGEKVSIEVESRPRTLLVNVYDRGFGFNPEKTRDFNVTEAASHRKTGGMGLHIIRRAMDEVDYKIDNLNGNKLVMVKHLRN